MHWICLTLLSVCTTQVDASVANAEEPTVSPDGVFCDESAWVKVVESESLAKVVKREPRDRSTSLNSVLMERFSSGWAWHNHHSASKLNRTPEDEQRLDASLRGSFGAASSWVDLIESNGGTAILMKEPSKRQPSNNWLIADDHQTAFPPADAKPLADRRDPRGGGALILDADSRPSFREFVSPSGDFTLWNLRR